MESTTSTPANKRKSVGGDSTKKSNKKRKSLSLDESTAKINGTDHTNTPSPAKKIKMFAGTSDINSGESQSKKKLLKSPNVSNKKSGNHVKKSEKENKGAKPGNEVTENKPVAGNISAKKNKKEKKKQKVTKEVVAEFSERKKKSRGGIFKALKEKVVKKQEQDATLADIVSRIKNIEQRNELTKTAKRKLATLKRMKKMIESGEMPGEANKTVAKDKSQNPNKKQGKKQKARTQQNQKPQQVKEDDSSEEASNEDVESDEEEAALTSNTLLKQDMEDSDDASEDEDAEDQEDEEEDDEDDDEEDETMEVEEKEDESESDENDEDDDDDDVVNEPPKKVTKQNPKAKNANQKAVASKNENNTHSNKDAKHRYVLHVSNLPYDATEAEIKAHFAKAGKITSVRIPKDKDNNKSRGFGYIELTNDEDYQKAFSMHQTFLKGRQIKVQYTKSGNKNSEQAKTEIKAKNAKLHALRKEGKLAGSIKENQKRSFRRKMAQKRLHGGDE